MTALGVTELVVESKLVNLKTVDTVDANSLNGSVLDVKVVDLGSSELMGREELGLRLATVSAAAIPVELTLGVKNSTRALNGDLVSRDLQKRALPLLVAPGGGSLEDNLGVVLELAEIKSLAGRDSKAVEDDGSARGLRAHGLGSAAGAGEGARAGTFAVGVDVVGFSRN